MPKQGICLKDHSARPRGLSLPFPALAYRLAVAYRLALAYRLAVAYRLALANRLALAYRLALVCKLALACRLALAYRLALTCRLAFGLQTGVQAGGGHNRPALAYRQKWFGTPLRLALPTPA